MSELNDQTNFSITSAIIQRKRFAGQGDDITQQWDVRQSVVEVNLYESIYEPVMTGKVVILDTSSLGAAINFQGQEIFNLEWRVDETSYSRSFYVFSVTNQVKSTNTTTSSLVLHIIERHGYHSMFRRLNGTKAGEIGNIIDALLSEVDSGLSESDESIQQIRIMENNRTPLEIVSWLTERATNDIGEPMFTYSTLHPDTSPNGANIKFRSLRTMMRDHPWEDDFKFVYSMVPSTSTEEAVVRDRQRIHAVHIGENDNIFDLAQGGGISSRFFYMDLTNRLQDSTQFNSEIHFENRQNSGSAGEDRFSMTDSFFSINDEEADTRVSVMDSLYVSGINNTGMFDGYRGYNEETQYDNHKFKISRESDLLMLDREKFTITLPGYHFGATDDERGAGTTINIEIPKDQPVLRDEQFSVDQKRSGRFLIMNARHIMNNGTNTYTVVLDIGRPDTPDDINNSERSGTIAEQRPR